jgi:hypothetical protein
MYKKSYENAHSFTTMQVISEYIAEVLPFGNTRTEQHWIVLRCVAEPSRYEYFKVLIENDNKIYL